ncbi:MAG: hypothetical protein ACPHID_01065 [Thermoplasmatota archaeon]
MRDHGFVLARPESHALLFWTEDRTWSDRVVEARVFDQMGIASNYAHRVGGSSILDVQTAKDWVRGPRIMTSRPRRLVRA